jgi:hypothetical protein
MGAHAGWNLCRKRSGTKPPNTMGGIDLDLHSPLSNSLSVHSSPVCAPQEEGQMEMWHVGSLQCPSATSSVHFESGASAETSLIALEWRGKGGWREPKYTTGGENLCHKHCEWVQCNAVVAGMEGGCVCHGTVQGTGGAESVDLATLVMVEL